MNDRLSHDRLRLITSNRLEHLAEAWTARLREEPLPPFAREIVVVQSHGMRRWLTLELARRRGIAAGLWMPFPRDLARCLSEALETGRLDYERGQRGAETPEPFDREILLWRIYGLLAQAGAAAAGSRQHPLRVPAAYLEGDHDGRKLFQLAARLASLFDDYQLFRGDWLSLFERGESPFPPGDPQRETAAWQAWLWRQLDQQARQLDQQGRQLEHQGRGEHLARRLAEATARLRELRPGSLPLPPRISVFGVSSLPPVFLSLLQAVARHLPVEIYFASPTWHYWGDLVSDREAAREARRFRRLLRRGEGGGRAPLLEASHFERGNSLLSGLGGQGRDFFNLLQQLDESGESWHQLDFENPGQDSVLHLLQSDILDLIDRGVAEPALPLPPGDLSLRVHVCHSPLREMEVLREELLHAFLEMPGLRPSDVLVLLPEIETYAPLIDAVFGVTHQGAPAIPYSVADRRLGSTQKPAAALLSLLELVGRRLTVAEVFALLESPALRRAAAIEESELARLRERVRAVGIRWAVDGKQRSRHFAVPAFEEASWQAGIDRLLFGYAIGPAEQISLGIAPAAGDGAGDIALLGRFLEFLDRLFGDLAALERRRTAGEWSRDLVALVGRQLLAADEEEELALQLLRDAFARLGQAQELAGVEAELPLEVILQFLRRVLDDDQKSGGFLSGGVTFCALRPMRSIPFRVMVLAGMGDAAFPRRESPHAFDLLAAAPRPGDRSPRADDRYLFLETLLAARERLLLLYPGASQRDAAERAPSVVVAELLDLLDRSLLAPDGRRAREHLVVRHPLQAWSPANFAGPRPSSSQENAAAGRALAAPRQELPRFVPDGLGAAAPLEEETGGPLELTLEDLIEAYTSPSRYYCQHVLQLALGRDEETELETESFAVEALPRFNLQRAMVERWLDGEELAPGEELALLRSRFDLPPGMLGEGAYRRLKLDLETLLGRLPPGLRGKAGLLPIEIAGPGWLLRGSVRPRQAELLRVRPGALRPRDLLASFIEGLAVQLAAPGALVGNRLYGRDGGCELRPAASPARAGELLGGLVAGYRQLRRAPIPFFEKASFVYAEQQQRLRDPRQARQAGAELAAARRAYFGQRLPSGVFIAGDEDAATRLLWRGRGSDPLADGQFPAWAERIYRPLLESRREIK